MITHADFIRMRREALLRKLAKAIHDYQEFMEKTAVPQPTPTRQRKCGHPRQRP